MKSSSHTSAPEPRTVVALGAWMRAQAITLAGVHEAVYLALSDRMRRLLPSLAEA